MLLDGDDRHPCSVLEIVPLSDRHIPETFRIPLDKIIVVCKITNSYNTNNY